MLSLALTIALATGCVTTKRETRSAAQLQLGTAYLREGSPASAIATLDSATELNPNNWDAWNKLGLAYSAQGATKLAEEAFRRSLIIEPGKAENNNNFGLFLLHEGRIDESINHFETALGDITYRKQAIILSNLGYTLHLKGDNAKAIDTLNRAVERAPHLCQAKYHRGLAYKASGSPKMALRDFTVVADMCSDVLGARYHAATILLEDSKIGSACENLAMVMLAAENSDVGQLAAELHSERCP